MWDLLFLTCYSCFSALRMCLVETALCVWRTFTPLVCHVIYLTVVIFCTAIVLKNYWPLGITRVQSVKHLCLTWARLVFNLFFLCHLLMIFKISGFHVYPSGLCSCGSILMKKSRIRQCLRSSWILKLRFCAKIAIWWETWRLLQTSQFLFFQCMY